MSHKRKKYKALFFLPIILGMLIVIIYLAYFFYFAETSSTNTPHASKSSSTFKNNNPGTASIKEQDITSVLESMGASLLHNPPISSNTPKIEIIIDKEIFHAEVIQGNIITQKGPIKNPDIKIITTQEEIIQAKSSEDAKTYVKNSVLDGKTKIEQTASQTTLFLKGYLDLYKTFQ